MSDSSLQSPLRTRKRFVVLAVLFGCVWINYMSRTNLSIAKPVMQDDLGIDAIKMGLIFSAFSWTYGWLQIPGGALVDVFRTRPLYALIMFLWSCATVLQGFVNSFFGLIGMRLSLGVFQAPSYPAHNKMVTRWFPTDERATAIATYTSAQFLVLALMPPVFVFLMNSVTWRGMFIVTGIVGILGSLMMHKIYRDPKDHKTVNQAELDYIESGGGLVKDGVGANSESEKTKFDWADLAEAFKHKKLWGVYIGQFCLGSLFVFFLTWFPSYLKDTRGLTLESMGYWTMIPPLGAFCGVLLSGTISDFLIKRGVSPGASRKIPVLCGMIIGSAIIGANYTDSTGMVILFMTIALFGNGLASIAWVFISSIAPIRCMGMVGGVFNFIGNLAGITLPIIVGFFAQDGDFEPALIYIAVMSILGFCSYFFLVGKVERIELPER
jgi:ACS family D-galactonate transporter-like MFS transporter